MLKNNIKSYSGLLNKCFVLLSFGRSLATKCVSLSNEPSTARPTLIDLNPVKFNYYPFRVSLDKCSGSCNAADDLSTILRIPGKTRDINIKVFNIIRSINGAKILIKHISCGCKCKFNTTTCNLNQKWNNDACHSESKKYCTC